MQISEDFRKGYQAAEKLYKSSEATLRAQMKALEKDIVHLCNSRGKAKSLIKKLNLQLAGE